MSRTVTLECVDAAGDPLGVLPPFEVAVPYWQEVADVVAAARQRFGAEVDVLRLLRADRPEPPGGHVTYLAQAWRAPTLAGGVGGPATPAAAVVPDGPTRRAPWAVPGGPAASVRWAVRTLAAAGHSGVRAVQQRTWNLSAIWRLDSGTTPVAWLKQVPPFFGHEAAVLRLVARLAPDLVPPVLAVGPAGRILLGDVPGEDRYGADADFCAAVAADIHPVQRQLVDRVGELRDAGVPDRRGPQRRIAAVARPHRHAIDGLAALVDTLPARLAAVADCGVPDTLVHGDLHPGNVRASGAARVILDWGDAGIDHPGYDILRLTEGLPASRASAVVAAWARRWRATVPGSDPERAVALLRPLATLRAAVTYADFLDRIEESEWPYHAADVPRALAAAVAATRVDGRAGIR